MKTLRNIFLTMLSMVLILALAAGIYKCAGIYRDKKWETQRVQRYEEVTASTTELEETIQEISKHSKEEIVQFIEENVALIEEEIEEIDVSLIEDPWIEVAEELSFEDETDEEVFQEDSLDEENSDEENIDEESDISSEEWDAGSSKENVDRVANLGMEAVAHLNKDSVSDNDVIDDESEDSSTEEENEESEDSHSVLSLKERQALRTSEEETQLWIEADQKVLDEATISFEGKKIACIGDSITAGSNLDDEEGYLEYTYPGMLGKLFGAEVQNLGIGGSSLGRYWDQAFCDRYTEIDEDTDIIIIMGGTNDGYCLHEDMIGDIDSCEPRTLYGDINDLFAGLENDYPDAKVYVMTPLPNLLHDVLRKERPELLPQTVVVDALVELAQRYNFDVIDNYNSNFFDSHDAEIVADYIPDSVHPSREGYDLLAKHVGAEILRIEEAREEEEEENEEIKEEEEDVTVSGNTVVYERDEDADTEESEDEESNEDDDIEDTEEEEVVDINKPKIKPGEKIKIFARD